MTEAEKKLSRPRLLLDSGRTTPRYSISIMTDDVIWSIPGSSLVSGEAHGVKGIIERASHFAAYSVNIEILHVVFGYTGVALLLHNTGAHNGKTLDEHLTTVIHRHGDRIKRLDTYISDVDMLNNYFG